jgi:hypothetical protein
VRISGVLITAADNSTDFVRFQVLMEANKKMTVFWGYCALTMETVSTSETSVSFYKTAWHNIPVGSLLYTDFL